jgi:hypothetical protein
VPPLVDDLKDATSAQHDLSGDSSTHLEAEKRLAEALQQLASDRIVLLFGHVVSAVLALEAVDSDNAKARAIVGALLGFLGVLVLCLVWKERDQLRVAGLMSLPAIAALLAALIEALSSRL